MRRQQLRKGTQIDGIHDMECNECGTWYDALEGEQYGCPHCGSSDVSERQPDPDTDLPHIGGYLYNNDTGGWHW